MNGMLGGPSHEPYWCCGCWLGPGSRPKVKAPGESHFVSLHKTFRFSRHHALRKKKNNGLLGIVDSREERHNTGRTIAADSKTRDVAASFLLRQRETITESPCCGRRSASPSNSPATPQCFFSKSVYTYRSSFFSKLQSC